MELSLPKLILAPQILENAKGLRYPKYVCLGLRLVVDDPNELGTLELLLQV